MLPQFPACLSVWLARKAGEAYEAGAFWEKFGSLIGAHISLNQRAELAQRFRDMCHNTMAAWLPPPKDAPGVVARPVVIFHHDHLHGLYFAHL